MPIITDAPTSQTTLLYESLRAAILSLEMSPGERISERGLEQAFGASRTPARAALMRLDSEGLVRRDGRSWMVSPIDLAEISAISELRSAVEAAAVRHAVERASDDDIDAVRELLEADRPAEAVDGSGVAQHVQAGSSFHTELVHLSGNAFMVDSTRAALLRLERTRWLEVRTPEARELAWSDHRAILDAIAQRSADRASELVAAHIRATNTRLIDALSADRQRFRGHGLAIVGEAPRADS